MTFVAFQDEPTEVSLVAVDIGYSVRKRSCGLAWTGGDRPQEFTFGQAVGDVAELLMQVNRPLLVIEAPLSTYHNCSGNPDLRGGFEIRRGWYWGAGVLTLAAARRFLRVLADQLENREIFLAEAFLPGSQGHAADAQTILDNFWAITPEELVPGVEPASDLIEGVPSVRCFVAPLGHGKDE